MEVNMSTKLIAGLLDKDNKPPCPQCKGDGLIPHPEADTIGPVLIACPACSKVLISAKEYEALAHKEQWLKLLAPLLDDAVAIITVMTMPVVDDFPALKKLADEWLVRANKLLQEKR